MSEPLPPLQHEPREANVRLILWVAGGLVAMVLLVQVSIRLYQHALARFYPAAASSRNSAGPREDVPPPRLQTSPTQDWEDYHSASAVHLHSYGWVDRSAGVIHLPIERALELTLQRGLPARSPQEAPAPGGTP